MRKSYAGEGNDQLGIVSGLWRRCVMQEVCFYGW